MSLQLDQVRPLHQRGLSLSQIAKELGVSRGAVAGVLWRAANPKRVAAYNCWRSGTSATREQMKAERAAFARRCFPVLPNDRQIIDLYAAGLDVPEIASKIGVHKDTVRRRLVRMGDVHKSIAVNIAGAPGIDDDADGK